MTTTPAPFGEEGSVERTKRKESIYSIPDGGPWSLEPDLFGKGREEEWLLSGRRSKLESE
jgi:hypothetical protein